MSPTRPIAASPSEVVVAIVPAKDRADSVGATVLALIGLGSVDRVVVVDDGSRDGTADAAREAGADVLTLPSNIGKGGAVAAGVAATPEATIYVLIDADLAATAAAADRLIGPVIAGEADLTIGVLPSAGGRGGFGLVRKLAARGVQRACGLELAAPLSGQRAIRARFLRDGLPSSERFGLEVAMSVDVARAGGVVHEVDVPMDHRHTGRSLKGFAHRGRQGADILRSLWPRVVAQRTRIGAMVLLTLLVCAGAMAMGTRNVPASQPLTTKASKVVVFGFQPFGFDDLKRGVTPNLQRLVDEGAIGAMSVRGVSRHPSDTEGYLSIGAGARLTTSSGSAVILPGDQSIGSVTAAEYVTSLSGQAPKGPFVAVDGPDLRDRNDGPGTVSEPGALATLLAADGHESAVVANSDHPALLDGNASTNRAAALAVMTTSFGIAHGTIDPGKLLIADTGAPFGVRASAAGFADATAAALKRSDLVVVDPGDLTRAQSFGSRALDKAKSAMWETALHRTDEILGDVLSELPRDTLVLVVSVRPPHGQFRLTPMVAWGDGVPAGAITTPSTQRSGLVAITDLAPTILSALGVAVPDDLPGNAIRYQPGSHRLGSEETYDYDTLVRERTYGGMTWIYIWFHALVYGLILFAVARRPRFTSLRGTLRLSLLCLGSLPAASFLVRLVPGLTAWFVAAQPIVTVMLALAVGWFASRRQRYGLSCLAWLCGITVAVIVLDIWTGTHLEMSSWLGYSFHSAGRFYGVPNTTFAVLGACSMVWAGIVVHHAEHRIDALWGVSCVLFVVLVSAGAPLLGADVGTLLTLGPVFALFVYVQSGRRVRVRNLVYAAVAMVMLVVVGAAADLARPPVDRTHLGRFASDLLNHGPSVLTDTIVRKQSANFRILQGSLWTRLIPIVAIFLFHPLVWERRAKEVFGDKPALRYTVWAIVAAALLGFATNDSGPLVIALFVAWIPPIVALILLEGAARPAVLDFADGSPSRAMPFGADSDALVDAVDAVDAPSGRPQVGAEVVR